MKSNYAGGILTAALLYGFGGSARAESLESLVQEAIANNPAIQAAHRRWEAAHLATDVVDALPDPVLTYGYFIESVETRVGPQEHKFALTQSLPWFGKRRQRGQVAEAEAGVGYERYRATGLRVVYQVKSAVYEVAYLRQAIEITRENIALVRRFEAVAQARMKAGGSASAAVKALVELGRLTDRLETLEDMLGPVVAKLNAAVNRPYDTPLAWPVKVPYHEPVAIAETTWEALAETSPALRALAAGVDRERENVQLMRKDNYPDVLVGVDYIATGDALDPAMTDSGKDAVVARIGLRLPLWFGKNRAKVDGASARWRAAEKRHEDGMNRLHADVKSAVFAYEDAYRKTRLYRDTLLPQAEHSLAVAEQAYTAADADFLDLIDAQRLLLEFQLNYQRARADAEIRRAEIDLLTGRADEFTNAVDE